MTKAIKEGRITTVTINGRELIDVAVADIQWAQNTRARGDSSSAAPLVAMPDRDGGDHFVDANKMVDTHHQAETADEEEAMTYDAARRRREAAEARMAEMKQAEMEQALIRVDAVRSSFANKLSGARDALLQIPPRLAPVLAAEPDMVRVTTLLEDAIRQALAELSGVYVE